MYESDGTGPTGGGFFWLVVSRKQLISSLCITVTRFMAPLQLQATPPERSGFLKSRGQWTGHTHSKFYHLFFDSTQECALVMVYDKETKLPNESIRPTIIKLEK